MGNRPGMILAFDLAIGVLAVVAGAWAVRAASAPVALPIAHWSDTTPSNAGFEMTVGADHALTISGKTVASLAAADRTGPLPETVRLVVSPQAEATAVLQVVQWLKFRGVRQVELVALAEPAGQPATPGKPPDRSSSKTGNR